MGVYKGLYGEWEESRQGMSRFMGAGRDARRAKFGTAMGRRYYGRGGIRLTIDGIVDFHRYFRGLPDKLQRKAIKKTLTEVKKVMVKEARTILAPYKQSGALSKSLGSTKKPRYPRKNPKTGDMVITVRPRVGYGTFFEGRKRDPRHYAHLVDTGFVPSGKKSGWSGVDFYQTILRSGKRKFIPIAKPIIASFIRKEKANHKT